MTRMKLILTDNAGYSMIETLVAILLLGIVSGLFLIFFNNIFNNPRILLKDKALNLASEETSYSLRQSDLNDTSYFSPDSILYLERKIQKDIALNKINVTVFFRDQKTKLAELAVEKKNITYSK